jgi:hypothetical protein
MDDRALLMLQGLRRWIGRWVFAAAAALSAFPASADDVPVPDASAAALTLAPAAPLPVGQLGELPSALPPLLWLLPALLLPLLFWVALAWRHAYATEPMRLRRRGVRDLRRLCDELKRITTPTPQQLNRCLRSIAAAWDVRVAAPTAADIAGAVMRIDGQDDRARRWQALWSATERALYAADARLPAEWLRYLDASVSELAMPARAQPYPARQRHWLPSLSALALVLIAATPALTRAGDPPAADRAQWQQAVAAEGRDWAAHRNLARLQLDEGDWNAAVAHALASFLLRGDADGRAVLDYALQQAGVGDPLLQGLFIERTRHGVPVLLTPSGWQRTAVLAATLLAAGLMLGVAGLYRARRRWWLGGGAAVALAGLGMIVVAQLGWSAYGDLRRADVALLLQPANLYPEPTDLVPQEETAPLAAGAVVRVRHRFLGWLQVQHADRPPGWLRSNAVMPLYGLPGPA